MSRPYWDGLSEIEWIEDELRRPFPTDPDERKKEHERRARLRERLRLINGEEYQ